MNRFGQTFLLWGLLGILVSPLLTKAELPFLHPSFSDHAVLQRKASVPIWGWTEPGEQVVVSLAHQTMLAKADETGRWEVRLGPFNPGGPHRLKVAGSQTVVVDDVMIGDVWLCSGQSNMEWPVTLSQNPEKEIAAADYPLIRLLTVPKKVSPVPVKSFEASWQVCSPETIGDFSAVGYYFGRHLHQEINVPIGLIDSTWGGTVAEAWTSGDSLKTLADFRPAVAQVEAWAKSLTESESTYAQALNAWWRNNDPGSAALTHWAATSLDDSSWKRMTLPGLWEDGELPDFDGIVWFRKTFSIPKTWADQELVLRLARIDDVDTVFVNGRPVGSTYQWNQDRAYRVPADHLVAGENVLAIRVLDTGGGGGVYGAPTDLAIGLSSPESSGAQPLAGWWKYRVSAEKAALQAFPYRPGSSPNVASVLYNGMIAPLIPGAIKGATWYQGESNANRPVQYRTLLPTMIRDWRDRFALGDFPFLIVQLANFMPRLEQPSDPPWAALREAQALTAERDEQTGLAVAIDIGEAGDIHPRNKQEVGRRLALEALRIGYRRELVSSGPRFARMIVSGRSAILEFDSVGSGLAALGGGELTGFSLAGPDGKFVWAGAQIDGGKVIVSSPEVTEPDAVRYAWANNPECNLGNREGLPAIPFRTDRSNLTPPAGFVSLFDGETLTGFQRINGAAVYEVVDGTIVGTTSKGSPNSFLCTEKRYRDFELQFEVRLMNPQLNSGMQIRSNSYPHYRNGRVHGYQVEIAANGTAGFIYDEGRRGWLSQDRSDPAARAAYQRNGWNHYRILCVGDVMRTWVNGVPVAVVEDSLTSEGFIGLQVHGVRADPHWQVAWRNLWIREIEEDRKTALFDGKTLEGWQGKAGGWHVDQEGNLARRQNSGYLWTESAYDDFELSLDFRISEGGNSGIFIRTDPANPVQGGLEIQVFDSFGKKELNKHTSGALYDALAPRTNAMRPAEEWNHCVIRAVGSLLSVRLNGEEVIKADLNDWSQARVNPDGSKNKFRRPLKDFARTGHIGLQDHGQAVWYRNIRLESL